MKESLNTFKSSNALMALSRVQFLDASEIHLAPNQAVKFVALIDLIALIAKVDMLL
jgi:hypothetical protein